MSWALHANQQTVASKFGSVEIITAGVFSGTVYVQVAMLLLRERD